MRLGPHTLSSNLFLSPLAGYTNLPMRLTVRELGGLGWATTDLVNARSLIEGNPSALRLVATCPEDRPLAVQLFGSVEEEMRDAALKCEALGAQSVDINMGCPVKKVTKIGGGSAMMTDFSRTARLVAGMVRAVKIPVTAKMRLGWDEENITAPDLARALEDVGDLCPLTHAGAGILRARESAGHSHGGRGRPCDSRHRKWGRDDTGGGQTHDRGHRMRGRLDWQGRILRSLDFQKD
jgi:tRNA-dihydrouridine synthase